MEQSRLTQQAESASDNVAVSSTPVASAIPANGSPGPQSCPTCGTAKPGNDGAWSASSYVYALGKIVPRFPSPSIEKEFAQVVAKDETKGLTDPQVLQKVLSERHNRYLVRKLCWVMSIEGLETYILLPRDPSDFDLLVESLRPTPKPADVNVVIGVKSSIAPPQMCNGLSVPIVAFDQIYSFDRESLLKAIPKPEKVSAKEFAPAAEELFDRIMQLADNAGGTDEHRALNYLAVRYHAIYAKAAEAHAENSSLAAVEVIPSRLSGVRNVMDVVLSFTNRATDVTEKFFTRVDVTEQFPFLVTKLSQYYDR